MSRVKGKIFEGDNTEKSLEKVNRFLEKDDIGYVEIKEISNCRLLLMYKRKSSDNKDRGRQRDLDTEGE
jgi:hypothetical protein